MPKFEKKLLDWMQEHLFELTMLAVTLLSLFARYSMRNVESTDYQYYLSRWYSDIKNEGGLASLQRQVGDYNILYQFIIALMTYVPIYAMYAYKLLSGVFDYLLAGMTARLVWNLTTENRRWKAGLAYAAVICSPLAAINSAAWAQCDSIYTFFLIWMLCVILQKKDAPPWQIMLLYGMAISFKFQAVFLLPFLLFYYFAKKSFSVLYFAIVPLVMEITALPGILAGRSVLSPFQIYASQTTTWPSIANNYPSFWMLMSEEFTGERAFGVLGYTAVATTIVMLGLGMVWLLKHPGWQNAKGWLFVAFLSCYICVFFLPSMHERYGFVYEILSIVLVAVFPKTLPMAISLLLLSMNTYGAFLGNEQVSLYRSSIVNLLVLAAYTAFFYHSWKKGELAPESSVIPVAERNCPNEAH